MERIFAGEIIEKKELATFNDDGDHVLNVVVGVTKTLFGDVTTILKRTVVLFRKDAEAADATLREGGFAVFTEPRRNPRVYQNKAGEDVCVVDILANGFTKLTKSQWDENQDYIQTMQLDGLDFTDEDWEVCRARATSQAKADDSGDADEALAELL